MSKKIMKLVDPHSGKMECKICGAEHYANIRPDSGGTYYRGSWQCQNGCKFLDDGTVWYGGSKKVETFLEYEIRTSLGHKKG